MKQECALTATAPVEWVREESYFFRLSKYQQPLLDFLPKPGISAAGEQTA